MTVKKDAYATHCSKDQKVAAEKWHQLRNLVLTTSTATANDVMPLLVFTTRGRVPQRRNNERLLQTYVAMRGSFGHSVVGLFVHSLVNKRSRRATQPAA